MQRDFNLHPILLMLKKDHLRMKDIFFLVQVLDKLDDPALVAEDLFAGRFLLPQFDFKALVQKGQFAQPVGEDVPVELGDGENLRIRHEGDLRARALRLANRLQLRHRHAAFVALVIDLAVAPHLGIEPLAQCVDA